MISFLKKLFCRSTCQDADACTIYIGNLSYSITKNQLESEFESFGTITSSRIIRDRQTGRSKGFGFVTFSQASAAQKALSRNGSDLRGRQLRVSLANEKDAGE